MSIKFILLHLINIEMTTSDVITTLMSRINLHTQFILVEHKKIHDLGAGSLHSSLKTISSSIFDDN